MKRILVFLVFILFWISIGRVNAISIGENLGGNVNDGCSNTDSCWNNWNYSGNRVALRGFRLTLYKIQGNKIVKIGKSYDFTRRLDFNKGDIGCSIDTLYKISVVLNTRIDKFFE